MEPTLKTKLLFWLLLGCLSTVFAEVVSGSEMFPFLKVWGIFVILPLYGLHIVVLSYVVYNWGRPTFPTLFLAGAIFGMYEAYITKVLWLPPWNLNPIAIGGVAAIETVGLALFWHPLMAFILPLLVGESLTKSRDAVKGLPQKVRDFFSIERNYLLLALLLGLLQSAGSPNFTASVVSGVSNSAVLFGLIYLWRRNGVNYDMKSLLPNSGQFKILVALLLLFYLFWSSVIRPEVLPGLGPQLTIGIIYALLFYLLYRSLRRPQVKVTYKPAVQFSWKLLFKFAAVFTLTSALIEFVLGQWTIYILLLFWVVAVPVGLWLFYKTVRAALQ